MTVKIAIMLILAAAFVFTLMYFKRKKDSEHSAPLQNSKTQTSLNKAEPAKVETTPSVVNAAVNTPIANETAPEIVQEAQSDSQTLGESILKRHHLSNIRQMVIVTTFPEPTDSALNRHYDGMIDAKAEDCLADEAKMARLIADYDMYLSAELTEKKSPVTAVVVENNSESLDEEQEPMLKRHHLHNIRLMLVATTFPRPSDSALSRHYDEMIDAKAEDCLNDEAKMARLIAEYATSEIAEPVVKKTPTEPAQTAIPEDSMLRRHYLTNLQG